MKKKLQHNENKWDDALNKDKNYIYKKHGYKYMLNDIEGAKVNLSKFKRGLSIFND